MYDDLRDKALENLEKRKRKVRAMQIVGVIFGSIALLLLYIRSIMMEADKPFMLIPIGIILAIYCIIHTAVLGLPFTNQDSITEEDIEIEVAKIFRKYKFSDLQDLSDEEELELKQIDRILNNDEDYV
ncbi:MAG: hypothetical protein AAGA77_03995 [Bacteroidota bacterium]